MSQARHHATSAATARRARRFRRQPKGAALVLALLVLAALMGLSLVATESTVYESSYVGAYRLLTMGHYVAEGGHALTLGQVTLTPGAVVATNYAIDDTFFGGTFSADKDGDTSADDPGSWGLEYKAAAIGGFTSNFLDPVSTNRIPGFSSSEFYFTKYTVRTTGFYQVGQPTLGDAFTRRSQATVGGQLYILSGSTGGM
jgi:hypothetical protein